VRRRYPAKAIEVMEEALRFYRDGRWNYDYPGGIEDGENSIDMGYRAKRALAHPVVRRAVAAAQEES